MRRFVKNARGAVTVFVSLLLIPAILVSGTAVDLARIHTARSIVQDANQLAANSVLTQYDAMLQDIYGLFAVMESDPILGEMLNEYIEAAVFGEDWQNRELGTFQLFYGSGLQPASVTPATGKHLRNLDVLRRQIEEYAKLRAPVIIIEEIWNRIDKFKKVKADSEAIEQKMAIDDKIDEIDKIYKEIYVLINEINQYTTSEQSVFDSVNGYLGQINTEMKALRDTRDDWTDAFDAADYVSTDDLENKHDAIEGNIRSLVNGGIVGSGWTNGGWRSTTDYNGIKQAISDGKGKLNDYLPKMDQLITKCANADQKKAELATMVDQLEQKLNSGTCSDEMVNGMKDPQKIRERENGPIIETKPSILEEYRSLLSYELKPMAEAVKNKNEPYISSVVGILNDIGYGNVWNNALGMPMLSLDNLNSLPSYIFGVDNIVTKRTVPSTDTQTLIVLASLTSYSYSAPNGFKPFQDTVFNTTRNKEFYDVLSERYNSASNNHESKKNEAESGINKLLKKSQELFKTVTLTPDGAKYYKVEEGGDPGGFGSDGDWGSGKEANNQTKNALNSSIIGQFGDLMDAAGNKILLLTYDTEMFSNFTTAEDTKTMSGVPMGTDVNYFFQSELEYLYHGNEKSARRNIATVSGLIFLVRFVFNYTSTFVIDEIKYELTLLSAPAGPYAGLVRELARLGYALAESAIDMKELLARPSRAMPLFKTKFSQWTFSLHSGLASIPETLVGMAVKEQGSEESGMFYVDYLRIFLLFKDGDTLAQRTADLITWNVTNKKNEINADEGQMGAAALFDMSKAFTDFTITTTVDLRMLFLSMPVAQRGVNGVIPPKTLPVTVTDYRGY